MSYSKKDVSFHADGYGAGQPAVNVKVGECRYRIPLDRLALDPVAGPLSEVAYHELLDQDTIADGVLVGDAAWEAACEQAWEALQTEAEAVFGPRVKVYQEGRSGGWAVVDGLPLFDSWDALDLARWRRFERYAREQADAVPLGMAQWAYDNVYAPRFYLTVTP